MLPAMSNAFAKQDNKKISEMMSNSFKFVFLLGCPMMFGISAVANNLVDWFYGDGYEPVGPLIMVISPIILFIGISTITGRQYLLPLKRQAVFTASVSAGAVINFLLNCLLIPKFDAFGASVATVVAELSVAAIQLFFVRKDLPLKSYFKENIKYFFFGIIMFIFAYAAGLITSGIPGTAIQVLAGIIVYFALILISKDKFVFELIHKLSDKIRHKKKSN